MSDKGNETIADKAKEGVAAATAIAKEQLDALKTKEGRDALKNKAKKGLASATATAKKHIGLLRTKEGRTAMAQKVMALSLKGKVILALVILCLFGVFLGTVKCISSSDSQSTQEKSAKRLGKKLGAGVAKFYSGWLKVQGEFEAATHEFTANAQQGKVTGADFMLITTKVIIPGAEAVERFSCPKEALETATEDGKRVVELCHEIGKLEKSMWVEYRNAAYMGIDRSKALSKRLDIDKLIDQLNGILTK